MSANRGENLGYSIGKHSQQRLRGLLPSLDSLALTEQLFQSVKISAQQPLLCCWRVFAILKGVKDRPIDDRPLQALEGLRIKVSSLLCGPCIRDSS